MRLPNKPPSRSEIQDFLSGKPSINVEELRPYIEIINSDYMHWDEIGIDPRFKNIDLKLLWAVVDINRAFSAKNISINGITLRYVQTPFIEKMLHDLDTRIGGKIEIKGQILDTPLQNKYLVNSLMEEAIASSQLEGAATTRVVAKKMLRENRKPQTHSEKMILNNYITMRFIKEHPVQNQKLSIDFIKEIHKLIAKDTLGKKEYEGAFRTDNEVKVFARDDPFQVIHNPPDYQIIEKLMLEVCNFINTESESYYLHPFVKAMVLHYMIGYIHPFNDGNGRTARALFYWYLITQRYDYLEYIAVSTAINNAKGQYARAYLFTETDNNDITYFIKFNLRALNLAVQSFETYVGKTREENKKIFEAIRKNPKLNIRQADILFNLSKNERPLVIAEMQKIYNITYQTARSDLLELERQDYLHKILKGKQFVFLLNKKKCLG
ncbi:Fic family protein [Candidatus Micrarchaeota archaeon]|nr:Fic family protein [Candidatus Micrarchaeota archaeon]